MDVGKAQFDLPDLMNRGASAKNKGSAEGGDFVSVIKSFLKDTNDLHKNAGEHVDALISGESTDVHDVMIALEKASVSFEMTMQLRNKMLEAYQELIRMPV